MELEPTATPRQPIEPGQVWWAMPDPALGQEQSGRRPVLIIASAGYLQTVTNLVITVPITTTDRHWPNHVALPAGVVPQPSFAMTEQVRTIWRGQLQSLVGYIDTLTLATVREWVTDFLTD